MLWAQVHGTAAVIAVVLAVAVKLWGSQIAAAFAGAWARGSAQAAAERRRLSRVTREAREANSGGRGLSGAWQEVTAAAQDMRGAVKGASAWARRENGPVRRVAAAAVTGAQVGARRAARAAAAARRRAAAGGGTSGTGSHSGSTRRRQPLGVCDQCGVTVARTSLKPGARDAALLLCFLCRRKRQAQEAGPAGPVATPAPAHPQVTAPAPKAVAAASATAPVSRLTPGTAAAARSLPAGGTQAMTAGAAPAATGGTRPGTAVAVRTRAAVTAGRPGTAPLPSGDSTTHGEQDRVAQAVADGLERVAVFQRAMEDSLTAAECPDDMIGDIAAWSDKWTALARRMREGLAADNALLDPYVDAVQSLPRGHRDSASPGYLAEIR